MNYNIISEFTNVVWYQLYIERGSLSQRTLHTMFANELKEFTAAHISLCNYVYMNGMPHPSHSLQMRLVDGRTDGPRMDQKSKLGLIAERDTTTHVISGLCGQPSPSGITLKDQMRKNSIACCLSHTCLPYS